MNKLKYYHAESQKEAEKLLLEGGKNARVIAGGTDLIGTMREKILPHNIDTLVSLQNLPELKILEEKDECLRLGAMLRLVDLAENETIQRYFPALAKAAASVASPQIRNMATLGGNICQEPRCWYYRYQDNKFSCLRKVGSRCDAVIGRNEYHSIFGAMPVKETPCETACPNHTQIPVYMELFRNGDTEGAAQVLFSVNPLAAVTGRVCPHTCEADCNRNEIDESVSIRDVERYLGNYILEHPENFFIKPSKESGKSIAIIGAGPAGLTAAVYLRMQGHHVTVIDANKNIGGMLYYGIPEYRLPKEILSRLHQILLNMGIEFSMGMKVGNTPGMMTAANLRNKHDAVLVSVGAWKSQPSGCPGEDVQDVFAGIDFLNPDLRDKIDVKGKKVVVIGGGNTAMDAARSALRFGAERVQVLYRRTRTEMPAEEEEIEEAIAEGVQFRYLAAPISFETGNDGNLISVVVQNMELSDDDESGRRKPVAIQGSTEAISADAAVVAIGQKADLTCLPESFLDEENGVFIAGDAAHGAATVVKAISDAAGAAERICQYLGLPWNRITYGEDLLRRFSQEALGCSCRNASCAAQELTEEAALCEAARCLHCGCVAVSPSDLATVIVALKGQIITSRRVIPADQFFRAGVESSTVLEPGEIVTAVELPKPESGSVQLYEKYRRRKTIDFPVLGIAIALSMKEDVVETVCITLGAAAPVPLRMYEVEDFLKGKRLDTEILDEASKLLVKDCIPLAENQHKITVAAVLFKRMLKSIV